MWYYNKNEKKNKILETANMINKFIILRVTLTNIYFSIDINE